MKTIFFPDQTVADGAFAATIGFFDGVHQGHRFLLENLKREAAERGMQSMAITFERHPRQVVQKEWKPELLTELHEKLKLLKSTGIDAVVVLRFSKQMAALSARDFMQLIYDRLGVRLLLTGYDNRFGHDRTEGFEDYQRYGQEIGIEVKGLPPAPSALGRRTLATEGTQEGREGNVSSSHVRQLLKDGNLAEANYCLGHPYAISGEVVHGEQIGRTIGFPTANLQPDGNKLIPKDGVYAVLVDIEDRAGLHGVMNIGLRPTFNGEKRTLEVNIIDGTGNLYGKTVTVRFCARLRDEQQFPSADALAHQIEKDKEAAEQLLANYKM